MRTTAKRHRRGYPTSTLLAILVTTAAACSGTAAPVDTAAATTTTPTSVTTTPTTTTTAPDTAVLDGIVAEFVGDADGGVVVHTVRNGTTATSVAGAANSFGGTLDASTPFRAGSISKPFVATMVLQMVDESLVELDATLATYLPDTPIGPDTTIRALLGHVSGIPNYTDQPSFFVDVLEDRERTYLPDEVLGYVTDLPLTADPSFSYSNTNYILLGQLIEQIDGSSLNDALQKRIVAPLGLGITAFAGGGVANPENLAGGWSPNVSAGGTTPYESIATSAWSAGALVSTATELRVFMEALFGGELISEASLDAMTDTGADGYGLGLFVAQLGADNPGYAHNGAIPGYSSTMGISPESGDVIVILTNNDQLVADLLAPQILSVW